MYKVDKSTKAEEDLTDIWIYSLQEWGIEQADRYLDEVNAGSLLAKVTQLIIV